MIGAAYYGASGATAHAPDFLGPRNIFTLYYIYVNIIKTVYILQRTTYIDTKVYLVELVSRAYPLVQGPSSSLGDVILLIVDLFMSSVESFSWLMKKKTKGKDPTRLTTLYITPK